MESSVRNREVLLGVTNYQVWYVAVPMHDDPRVRILDLCRTP